jgi:hypothetical protein
VQGVAKVLRPARTWRPHRGVLVAAGCALALHVLWLVFLAGSGGDLAAQDAWTGFAVAHPTSAYNFAWYGGMHPASYSLISPYVMSVAGVRTTMLVAGTVSAALLALLLSRLPLRTDPVWAGLYAAVALTGNAVSGRVTFGLGVLFGLGALAVMFTWPHGATGRGPRLARGASAVLLAGLATAASPVAGLCLGVVAAALWVRHRRVASIAVGVAPVVVVLGTGLLFPFHGIQPISWQTACLPLVLAVAGVVLVPRGWRLGRTCSAVYGVAVLLTWVLPSPIGTNIARMALLFGGVLLVAAASGAWWTSLLSQRFGPKVGRVVLVAAILTSSVWQVAVARQDVLGSKPSPGLDAQVQPLVAQLDLRGADLGRVEVVPMESHREASALAPYVNLARGWNRQADVARNPMFYRDDQPFTIDDYRQWLRRWAVRLVVLPASTPDYAGLRERGLLRGGLPFLREVWSDASWTLYEVADPTPLASAPATVAGSDAAGISVRMPAAGSTVLRIAWSPWLSLVDQDGHRVEDSALAGSCLARLPATEKRPVDWVVLTVTRPGLYRVAAPYALPRGTPCPEAPEPR